MARWRSMQKTMPGALLLLDGLEWQLQQLDPRVGQEDRWFESIDLELMAFLKRAAAIPLPFAGYLRLLNYTHRRGLLEGEA
jgi:hypothetical protein